MGSGNVRNELCWCGSGIKYKKCHLGREAETPVNPGERFSQFRRHFSKKYCLAPGAPADCDGSIVRAHTLQRRGALSEIEQDGHVLGLNFDLKVLIRTNGRPEMQAIGQRNASTFTGFCAFHDNALFSPLEDRAFDGTREQCFLLHYRAACREVFQKVAVAGALDLFRDADRGRDPVSQFLIQNQVSGMVEGTESGLSSMVSRKRDLDERLTRSDFGDIRSLLLWLDEPPPVMAAGGVFPDEDFDGSPLQDLSRTDYVAEFMGFTLGASDGQGFAAFSWIDGQGRAAEALAQTLARRVPEAIPDLLVVFAFESLENTLCRKTWWDGLPERCRQRLLEGSLAGTPYAPVRRGERFSLDGCSFGMPDVRRMEWVGD